MYHYILYIVLHLNIITEFVYKTKCNRVLFLMYFHYLERGGDVTLGASLNDAGLAGV